MNDLLHKYGPELLFAVANHLDQSGWAEKNNAMDLVNEIYTAVGQETLEEFTTVA
jgi:hypothetical protein